MDDERIPDGNCSRKDTVGMSGTALHFHDLRGTAATKFYVARFTMREIAETLAWDEEHVARIIHRYVGRSAAIKARIRKFNERGTDSVKTGVKTT
jgi:hypothetical protein